jgi:DNA polymerase-1
LYGKTLLIHNVAFEYRVFANEGIDPTRFKYHDTYAMAWLLDPSRQGGNGLKSLVKNLVGYQMTEFASFGKGNPALVPIASMAPYAIDDVVQMGKLYHLLDQQLDHNRLSKVYQEIYRELVPYSVDMSLYGIKVDVNQLLSLEAVWSAEVKAINAWFAKNTLQEDALLSSSKWINDCLIQKLKLFPVLQGMERGASGLYSADVNNLKRWAKGERNTSKLGKKCAEKILRFRALSKLISAYTKTLVDKADHKHYCHPKLGVMGTKTGRWNCTNPNLQTVPSRSEDGQLIRQCFVADEGMALVGADYSQIEYRLLAHFTESEPLLDAYHKGQDLHARTASIVYNKPIEDVTDQERSRAKGVNFGIIYGQGPAALAEVLGLSEDNAKKFLLRYFKLIPGVKDWMEDYKTLSTRRGYTATLLGRRRFLPDLKSTQMGKRGAAERRVINTRIQGSAADITNLAIRNLFRAKANGIFPANIQLMVHDEIIVTCKVADADYARRRDT